jgi:hypothetical protein
VIKKFLSKFFNKINFTKVFIIFTFDLFSLPKKIYKRSFFIYIDEKLCINLNNNVCIYSNNLIILIRMLELVVRTNLSFVDIMS